MRLNFLWSISKLMRKERERGGALCGDALKKMFMVIQERAEIFVLRKRIKGKGKRAVQEVRQ